MKMPSLAISRTDPSFATETLGTLRVARQATGAFAAGALTAGALAAGALAIGALAIGALAIGRLAIGRARIRRVEIDELVVRRLRITEGSSVPSTPERSGTTAADA